MHVHKNDEIISQSNSIANNKSLPLKMVSSNWSGLIKLWDGLVKLWEGWSRQIMGKRLLLFAILLLCEIITSFV